MTDDAKSVAVLAELPGGGTAPRERTGVQSLERAFAILECIAAHRNGVMLTDLSKQVGLHNSTAFHLVKTMVSLHYVRQSPKTKRYHVGRMLYMLAANSIDDVELVKIATPILERLSLDTGESSHIAVPVGDAVAIVARAAGPGVFQLIDRAGGMRPAYCTASGKILLAAMPPEQLDRYLATARLDPMTPKSVVEPVRLRAEIERVKKHGVAFDDAEFNEELRCIAAPIRDFSGKVTGSIGISGPVWRLTLQRVQEATTQVLVAAAALSRELGGHPQCDKSLA